MSMKPLGTSVTVLLLAIAIHADWHFARPAHHRLSLDLSWHWLIAVPVFALAAWYIGTRRPSRPASAGLLVLGLSTLIGAVIEPAYEYWLGGATWDWAFGPERTWAAVAFVATGVVAYLTTYLILQRRDQTATT